MHAIHTTPGFIIDSRAYGEAGKVISIFTRDFGLVSAVAQGIRLEKSKLRYSTQDHSLGSFSLVRGKEVWRLTSAAGDVGSGDLASATAARELVARLALLLRRLLQGEEAHPELFACVESCLRFLQSGQAMNEDQLKTVESVAVLQIMHALGYVGSGDDLEKFIDPTCFGQAVLMLEAAAKRAAINKHINKALKESHL